VLRFSLLFVAGTLIFHQLPDLPGWRWWLGEVVLGLSLWRVRPLRPWLAFVLGLAWSHGYALLNVPHALPGDGRGVRLTIDARVVSLVQQSADAARFLVEVDRITGPDGSLAGRWRFRLSWHNPPPIHTGEAWRLPVRLRAAHGYASPGAWDYEGWLYWQGVRHVGYVDPQREARRLQEAACCWLNRMRARVSGVIDRLQASPFARGVLKALVIGDASGLGPDAKELFRATGTSHLMVISGLHIGLLAGLGTVVVAWGWRRRPRLCGRVPAYVAGAVGGLVLAAGYAALAGLSLPTQRALIMLLTVALGQIARRTGSTLHGLAIAAVGVVLWHPPSVVSAGFWLSFVAVLAILAALRWSAGDVRWRTALRVQLAVGIALWPVLSVFGMPSGAAAPLVNLILVPLFGLFVVPLSLLGVAVYTTLPGAGGRLLQGLGHLLDLLRQGLEMVAQLAWPDIALPGAELIVWLAMVLAVALLLVPPGFPLRRLAPALLLIPWLPREPALPADAFMLHILDVGQGLSAVVETRHHTLVFDTGPEFASGFSTAAAVLVPFLTRRGRPVIDRLVLSHGDKDHAGGVRQLLDRLRVRDLQSGEPVRVGFGARRCVARERWQWDGVAFEFLHPGPGGREVGNNASCVLRIGNAAGSVLLTGDIEAPVERRLGRLYPDRLRADVVIAPHHGSRSSSSAPFVAATQPLYVVYTAGWANRYGFPAADVDRRWRGAGARPVNTAALGTLSFRFAAPGRIEGPYAHRRRARRFWWHDGGSAAPPHAVSSGD